MIIGELLCQNILVQNWCLTHQQIVWNLPVCPSTCFATTKSAAASWASNSIHAISTHQILHAPKFSKTCKKNPIHLHQSFCLLPVKTYWDSLLLSHFLNLSSFQSTTGSVEALCNSRPNICTWVFLCVSAWHLPLSSQRCHPCGHQCKTPHLATRAKSHHQINRQSLWTLDSPESS
jgi:hypothetical protein